VVHTKHLRAFLAVARWGSLARAADELYRAPSAVSRSLRELESSLETPLFERRPGTWLLTEAGRVLQRRARDALAELAEAREALCRQFPERSATLLASPFFSLGVHERRLAILITFDERRHVGEVAQQLGLSQPAVSMALREIEESLGIALFDRAPSGIRLNEAGELLTPHVKRALSSLRLAVAEIALTKGVVTGQVVVGALPFGRPYLLPVAIGRVLARHPLLSVRTVEAPLGRLVALLRVGDIDFLVGALPPGRREEGLVREELLHEPMAVLARAGHPLARKRRLRLEECLRARWVLPQKGTPTRDALASVLERRGLAEPAVAVESADLSIIRGLLLETDMISAASRALFQHELKTGALVCLPVRLPGTERPIGILRRTAEHSSPGAQLLIEALRAVPKVSPGRRTPSA
jgi:LysR family transcriptional regulator of gallate degradation